MNCVAASYSPASRSKRSVIGGRTIVLDIVRYHTTDEERSIPAASQSDSISSEVTSSMAGPLISLLSLSADDVQRSIEAIVNARSRPDAIAEYVASIDWSGATGNEPAVRLLGTIEHLATEFAESEISEAEFWIEPGLLAARPVVRVG